MELVVNICVLTVCLLRLHMECSVRAWLHHNKQKSLCFGKKFLHTVFLNLPFNKWREKRVRKGKKIFHEDSSPKSGM